MRERASLLALAEEYERLQRLDGCTPQVRGQRFNQFVADVLACWGIEAYVSVRAKGEIDVAFAVDGTRYVMEIKWEKDRVDTGAVAKLQKRLRQRLAGTYGIFLSMSGYSAEALTDIGDGERLEVLLLDAEHLEALLQRRASPQQLLSALRDRASFHGQAYVRLAELMAGYDGRTAEAERHDVPVAPQPRRAGRATIDLTRSDRGNPADACTVFEAYGRLYWVVAALIAGLCLLGLLALVVPGASVPVRVVGGVVAVLTGFMVAGFVNMARRPVRLEIGSAGLQLFSRRGATWIPWDAVGRVNITRVKGSTFVVVWCPEADLFPIFDTYGSGPTYVPQLEALAFCPTNVLRAKRHHIMRALRMYGGERIGHAGLPV